LVGQLGGDAGRLPEVSEQRSVEAVEDREVALVGVFLALARASPEHLLEQNAALYRPQEYEELQVADVYARRQEIHRDCDAGIRAIAELSDSLEGPVNAPSNLLDEGVAAIEDLTRGADELISVRDVWEVIRSEDQRLWEAPILFLVFV